METLHALHNVSAQVLEGSERAGPRETRLPLCARRQLHAVSKLFPC